MPTKLNEQELRVLRNIHLLGYMGSMGNMNKKERQQFLQTLITKKVLTTSGRLTPLGIELSAPFSK